MYTHISKKWSNASTVHLEFLQTKTGNALSNGRQPINTYVNTNKPKAANGNLDNMHIIEILCKKAGNAKVYFTSFIPLFE